MQTYLRWLASLTSLSAASTTLAQVEYRAVAMAGQPAPGLTGVTFQSVSDPVLSASGLIAFNATLTGQDVTPENAQSLWKDAHGILSIAYRAGAPAPGTQSNLGGISGTAINASGHLAYAAALEPPPSTVRPFAIYSETAPDTINPVVIDSTTAFTVFVTPLFPFNSSGLVAWNTPTSVTSSDGWTINTASTVPDSPSSLFRFFSEPLLADSGAVVFRASYALTPSAPAANWIHALYSTRSGSLSSIAATGGAANGLPAGATLRELGITPLLDTSGVAYVWARFQGGATIATRDTGLFRESASGLVPIVLAGDAIADIPGATFASFDRRFALAPSGSVVFHARLAGAALGTDSGLFIAHPGQPPRLFARRGQSLPGMPASSTITLIESPHIGAAGQVLFTAWLSGTNGYALFAGNSYASPSMLLRTGGTFTTTSGPQTIRSMIFDHEQEQTGHAQIVGRRFIFWMSFENNTNGLFLGTFSCSADFNGDGDIGTDADIEAFFACLAGNCCPSCTGPDFDGDGDPATDADIEAFFRVLSGGDC